MHGQNHIKFETLLICLHLTISNSHKMPQHCIARIWNMFICFSRFRYLFIHSFISFS